VALFSESNGRILVTVAAEQAGLFAKRFDGLPCHQVGQVTAEPRLAVRAGERVLIDLDAAALTAAFKETLDND
jgi:phosphoribosylformylglycinamidine (FGAM) synthase-like enzyme